MVEVSAKYNSNLLKGTGLIQEMLMLIDVYDEQEKIKDFLARVLQEDLLSKSTENRVKDLVLNIFRDRYLGYEINIPGILNLMRQKYVSMEVITQLFYIYTCRANLVLKDFIEEVYFDKVAKGIDKLQTEDPKIFIRDAISDEKIEKHWATSTINKVSEHIIACLIDFHLIERNKTILNFRVLDQTANYLAHELHFRGVGDNDIWQHEDWKLFGLEKHEVISILERLSIQGSFIMQFSGELLKISWHHKNMEEFIENECR